MPNSPPLFLPKPPQSTSDIGAIKRWLYLVYLSIFNSAGIVVPIPITEGGTGADNLSDAQTNLGIIPLPIAGDSDLVLQTNGSNDPVWSTHKLIMGGDINVENALTTTGDSPLTLTVLGITDSTLPAGTHSLAPLDSPTFTGGLNLSSSEPTGQLLSVINTATTGTPTAGVLVYSQVTGGGYPYVTFLMTAPTKIFTVGIDPSDFGFKVCRDASTSSVVDFSISTAGIATFTNTVNANITGNAGTVTTAATRVVYVDAQGGNDTTGNGSSIQPYATVAKANSVITTASASNLYTIVSQGNFAESPVVKPFVSIFGYGNQASQFIGMTLDSSWSSTTLPKVCLSNLRLSGNLNFSVTTGASAFRIDIDNVDVVGTTTLTGRSGSDFYYLENCELVGAVTIQDCLFQSYNNVYDSAVLYRNSIAPGSSLMQSAGDLFNGALNVTAGAAQTIIAFVNNSSVTGGSTVTGATANITYTPGTYGTGTVTLVTGGTSTVVNTISLKDGGTNASLTASNGGIFYSTATAGAILSGTATAGQIIRSGANAAPSWSTTTYPATDAINTIRYFSSANVAGNIAAAASSVLITSAGDVPSLSQTLPTAVQNNITAVNSAANTLSIGGSVKTFTSGTANVPSYSAVTAFSPGLSFGGATTGIVYTQQSGFYRTTTYPNGTIETAVWGIVRISSKGSATGTARLTTLPTAGGANNSNTYAPFFPAGITVAAGAIPFLQLVNFASTAIITSTNFNGGAFTAVTDAQFANTASVAFNFTYWNN